MENKIKVSIVHINITAFSVVLVIFLGLFYSKTACGAPDIPYRRLPEANATVIARRRQDSPKAQRQFKITA